MTARSITPLNPMIGAAKGRILIFNSDRVVAGAVRDAAADKGFQVVGICENPEQCLQAVRDMRPNLVVSGIFFNGEPDGIELSRTIQEELGVPVIFVGESDDQLLLLQISMTQPAGYVPDSRDSAYLGAVLNRALKGARPTFGGGPF